MMFYHLYDYRQITFQVFSLLSYKLAMVFICLYDSVGEHMLCLLAKVATKSTTQWRFKKQNFCAGDGGTQL